MSVFTGKPAPAELQSVANVVARQVQGLCFGALDAARSIGLEVNDGEIAGAIGQGIVSGLVQFAMHGGVPDDEIRELINTATSDVIAQVHMHVASGGQPAGHA